MAALTKKEKGFSIAAMIFGFIGMAFCVTSLGLSVTDSAFSRYALAIAMFLLGLNSICLHFSTHKGNTFFNILTTSLMFFLAVMVSISSMNIYFLTVSFFLYSLLIAAKRVLYIKENPSRQSIVFGIISVSFCFVYSFIFLFPSIYEKHATSVSNWSFIVLSYTIVVLFNCIRNTLLPLWKKFKLDTFTSILRSNLALEIIMALLLLITLCSIYFCLVEPNFNSFADALWYSFSVVTTIGFGDFTVTTTLGRILSVLLGIYSLIVVGLITSIIVGLYNDMYRKREDNRLRKIEKKEKELEEKVDDSQEAKENPNDE